MSRPESLTPLAVEVLNPLELLATAEVPMGKALLLAACTAVRPGAHSGAPEFTLRAAEWLWQASDEAILARLQDILPDLLEEARGEVLSEK